MEKRYFFGFTLVELMIVLGLLAVLAILALAYFRGQLFKGNDARRKADLNRIQIAAEEYEKDNNCYPAYITCGSDTNQPVHPYLNNVPCDPVTNASYFYEPDSSSVCPRWYRIYTVLDNLHDTDITSDIGPSGTFNFYVGSPAAPSLSQGDSIIYGPGGEAFYGCKSGVLVPISWNPSIPGPECEPTFASMGFAGACGSPSNPQNECIPQ